jgi:VWFA-related protein
MLRGSRGIAFTLALSLPLTAQAPKPGEQVIRAEVSEVLVDVVVRDRKGKLLRGLSLADFTVSEDGAPQKLTSIREMQTPGTALPGQQIRAQSPGPAGSSASVHLPRQIRLVSLVFDRLSVDGRRYSRRAAHDFVARDIGPNVYYGVFHVDRRFTIVQPYTNNRALIRSAIDRATSGERTDSANNTRSLESVQSQTAPSEGAAEAVALAARTTPGGITGVDGGPLADEQALLLARGMQQFADQLNREDLGRTTILSLWAIIQELERLPGRKSMLYFAESLDMPNALWSYFDAMVGAANRANVTVHSIDARGLQIAGDMGAVRQLSEAGQSWSRYARNTDANSVATLRGTSMAADFILDSLKANAQEVLRDLAESTGGTLIANTNDPKPLLDRISEEINSYYELTYRSANPAFDGRFRKITVSVSRPGVSIQARDGYFALPPLDGQLVFPFEVPLLHTLGRQPLPRELDFRAGVIPYRARGGTQQASLVFDLPLRDVTFNEDPKAKLSVTHLAVLALVKDEKGAVVAKLSRDVPLSQPLDKVEQFRQGRFIVTRVLDLPPGRYTIESVAADLGAARFSARKSVFVVTPPRAGPALSGLALLRRVDAPAPQPDAADPLHWANGRIIPTLATTIALRADAQIPIVFKAYPDPANSSPPRLVLEIVKDGAVLQQASPDLPKPDATGAIPYIAAMPMKNLSPGEYVFRATLVQGAAAAQQSLPLTLQ